MLTTMVSSHRKSFSLLYFLKIQKTANSADNNRQSMKSSTKNGNTNTDSYGVCILSKSCNKVKAEASHSLFK